MTPREDPSNRPDWAKLHLWQIAALRDIGLITSIVVGIWLLYILRAVTIPLASALILATLFHPVVDRAHHRFGIPRVITTTWIVALLVAGAIALGMYGLPQFVASIQTLIEAAPRYAQALATGLGIDPTLFDEQRLREALPRNLSDLAMAEPVLGHLRAAAVLLLGVAGQAIYVLIAGVFTLVLFSWAVTHFEDLPDLRHLLPKSQRAQIWNVIQQCSDIFVAFVRGQILVAIFTTGGFAAGFTLVGVPHAAVAALFGGVLSFVPNGQAAGWLLAMIFAGLESEGITPFPYLRVFVFPTLIYAITQSLETFVVTPLVQGQYTKMHPLAVLGAIIAGASVGGLVGILLAIPITASAWIIWKELLSPALSKLADER